MSRRKRVYRQPYNLIHHQSAICNNVIKDVYMLEITKLFKHPNSSDVVNSVISLIARERGSRLYSIHVFINAIKIITFTIDSITNS